MVRPCERCPEVKNSPGQYKQGDTIVCDRCFYTVDDLICLCCNGRRKKENTVLMMSCPCYDNPIDDSDQWESDGGDSEDEPWSDDDTIQ
jgi:hypothetical protein